jgi:hypothetical protein
VQEGLDLHARDRGCPADLLERELPRQRHARKAQVAERLDAGPGVGGELGAGVQLQLREVAPGHPGDAQILDDDGIGPDVGERAQRLHQLVQLTVQHQGVQRHEDTPRQGERARVPDQPVQLLEREVLGVGSGREPLQPKVDGVGPVLERRQPGLHAAGRREQLGAARCRVNGLVQVDGEAIYPHAARTASWLVATPVPLPRVRGCAWRAHSVLRGSFTRTMAVVLARALSAEQPTSS